MLHYNSYTSLPSWYEECSIERTWSTLGNYNYYTLPSCEWSWCKGSSKFHSRQTLSKKLGLKVGSKKFKEISAVVSIRRRIEIHIWLLPPLQLS